MRMILHCDLVVHLTSVPVSRQSQARLPPGQTLQSLQDAEQPLTFMWPQDKEAISGEDMISFPATEWKTNQVHLFAKSFLTFYIALYIYIYITFLQTCFFVQVPPCFLDKYHASYFKCQLKTLVHKYVNLSVPQNYHLTQSLYEMSLQSTLTAF